MIKMIVSTLSLILFNINLMASENAPSFDNGVLTLPRVDLSDSIGQYQHVQLKRATDGRWDLTSFQEANLAKLETATLTATETFPVQILVTITGYFPSGCHNLGETFIRHEPNRFTVSVNQSVLQTFVACTQALVPFQHTFPLDVYGLAKGRYEVSVNNQGLMFELKADNRLDSHTAQLPQTQ